MPAVLDFGVYAVALVCLGIAAVVTLLVIGLLYLVIDIINSIPLVSIGTGWIDSIARHTTHGLGVAFHAIDGVMGASLHLFARYTVWLWDEFKAHAVLIALIASGLEPLYLAYQGIKKLVHHLTKTTATHNARVKTLEKEYKGIEAQLRHLEKEIPKGIGNDMRVVIPQLELEVKKLSKTTVPAAQGTADTALNDVTQLGKWIAGSFPIPRSLTFAGAVALALGALGLTGLRCSNFKNLLSKFGCGLGTLLNDLLGLVIAGLVLEGVCEFLPLVEDAFGAVAGPLVHLLNEVPLGKCETLPEGWARLDVRHGPLPPAQTLGAFPA